MKKKRLITSALPYVNNIPHLGNIIGCVLSADVFARYCRMAGYDTLYICGTDEYGTTTETKARQEGITPKELCDKYHSIHKEIYQWFNISFSTFGRTSHPKQTEIVQYIFKKLYEAGYIVEDILTQPYSEKHKMFLADRYVEGVCPHCDYEQAKGDQCENCSKLLDPAELIEPHSTLDRNDKLVFRETKHLFLDLEKLKPVLEKWINKESENWAANAVSATRGWLEQGLKKRCITRDLEWGVPVPLKGYENKVFYVWFDAPIGYISIAAAAYEDWQDWWKNPQGADLYQFMGKDNIPFHTVFFPASLLGTGENWTTLNMISSTEYLNYEDLKFSKSRGTGVFGDQARDTGIDADLFRYYLLRNRPEKNDTQFFWHDFMEKVNGEIIANYANLINRTLQFIVKFFNGKVPQYSDTFFIKINFKQKVSEIIAGYEKVELKKTLLDILELCSEGNKYFQDSEPWSLVNEAKEKAGEVIGTLTVFIKDISILLYPYIPGAVVKVFKMLKLPDKELMLSQIGHYKDIPGTEISQPEVLFTKLDKKEIEKLRIKFSGQQVDVETPEKKFSKLHLKVGKILEVEKHPEADKLYIEKVDMGNNEIRQIVSGLVPYYQPEELIGKKIVLAYNLQSAELRGVKSEGMLLAASIKKKNIVEVISPDCEIGTIVAIEGAEPNKEEITIDEFFKVPISVKDYIIMFEDKPVLAHGKVIKVEKVETGKVG